MNKQPENISRNLPVNAEVLACCRLKQAPETLALSNKTCIPFKIMLYYEHKLQELAFDSTETGLIRTGMIC